MLNQILPSQQSNINVPQAVNKFIIQIENALSQPEYLNSNVECSSLNLTMRSVSLSIQLFNFNSLSDPLNVKDRSYLSPY